MSTNPTAGDPDRDRGLEPDERLDAADLTEDPRLDPEALCLCGLLWSGPAAATRVAAVLEAGDFARPAHGELFDLIATALQHGRPHDPASIAAVLADRGAGAHHVGLLGRALADATAAGATPESTGHHAINVLTAGDRRSFHTAAAALAQAAEQLPTDELFDHLVAVGRAQRSANERLKRVTAASDAARIP